MNKFRAISCRLESHSVTYIRQLDNKEIQIITYPTNTEQPFVKKFQPTLFVDLVQTVSIIISRQAAHQVTHSCAEKYEAEVNMRSDWGLIEITKLPCVATLYYQSSNLDVTCD